MNKSAAFKLEFFSKRFGSGPLSAELPVRLRGTFVHNLFFNEHFRYLHFSNAILLEFQSSPRVANT